jgi:hypothetical protein
MPTTTPWRVLRAGGSTAAAAVGAVLLAGCGGPGPAAQATPQATPSTSAAPAMSAPSQPPASSQAPVPAESNPPGDIPDSTMFVPFRFAAARLALKVPEGWARADTPASSTFTSTLNSITIATAQLPAAPTVTGARSVTVPALRKAALAFRLQSVRAVPLPAGAAVEIVYQANSPANSVTGRQYRLVIERFELWHQGRGAVLTLSSPVGSDNVDPWRTVSESLRWQ